MIQTTIASETRNGPMLLSRAGLIHTAYPPDFIPPMIELRKAALPSLAIGEDQRLWPRLSFRVPVGGTLVIRADRDTGAGVLRMIARQTAAAAGAVCLGGRDIWLMSAPEIRDQIAFADAGIPPDPEASLWQVMARAFLPPGCDWGEVKEAGQRRAIAQVLGRMGLADQASARCATLDPADALALVIARALLRQPAILLMDATAAEGPALPALRRMARAPADSIQTTVIAISGSQSFPDWAAERLDLCDGRF